MYTSETKIRVRYAETDRMGYVYYGNYAQYFEVGRVEALRKMDFSYKELEDSGIFLPVLDFSVAFSKPALYDDLLTVETCIPEIPATRIKFIYKTTNELGVQLNEAATTLVFVSRKTNKPCLAPEAFLAKIRTFF